MKLCHDYLVIIVIVVVIVIVHIVDNIASYGSGYNAGRQKCPHIKS
jgi:uncharacterized integral membrane protein